MEAITDDAEALRVIKRLGFLNYFSTPADAWFDADDAPMEQYDLGRLIDPDTATRLIESGAVVEANRGHPPDDGSTQAICYRVA
jgi:hypothetical protein